MKFEKNEKRCRGMVVSFLPRKGYGFISGEDGEKAFVHYSEIRGEGFRTLSIGEEVEYTCRPGARGLTAVDVKRLNPPAEQIPESDDTVKRKW